MEPSKKWSELLIIQQFFHQAKVNLKSGSVMISYQYIFLCFFFFSNWRSETTKIALSSSYQVVYFERFVRNLIWKRKTWKRSIPGFLWSTFLFL
jgi:hypothetical protein